jgi:hypothetical protein
MYCLPPVFLYRELPFSVRECFRYVKQKIALAAKYMITFIDYTYNSKTITINHGIVSHGYDKST